MIDVAPKTLRKWYRRELETAEAEANAKVAESLYRQATKDSDPSIPAMIFWLKVRAGWSEKSVLEIVRSMTDDELEAEAAKIIARKSGA